MSWLISERMQPGGAELRAALRLLLRPWLWWALVMLAAVVLSAAQMPRRYLIDVGVEEGWNADLPFLATFHAFERTDAGVNYRWAIDGATVSVPVLGGRAQVVELTWLNVDPGLRDGLSAAYRLTAAGLSSELPIVAGTRRHQVLVPRSGDAWLALTINGEMFRAPGDVRDLLLPLERIVIRPTSEWAFPDINALLGWSVVLIAAAIGLQQVVSVDVARRVTIGLSLLIAAAVVLDGPRWAYGVQAAIWATVSAAAAIPLLRRLYRRFVSVESADQLVLLTAATFVLRLAGRLYPASMMGDLGFHRNRFYEAITGTITLISLNRGIEFPYPPAPYLIVAPLVTLGFSPETALQIVAGLADALSVPLVYLIARRVLSSREALLAAAIYVSVAATLLTHWWSFSTHIISQLLYLVVILVLLQAWQHWTSPATAATRRGWTLALAGVTALLMVGHFGYLINITVLFGLLTAAVWWAAWRGDRQAQAARIPLTVAVFTAGVAALMFFYSSYLPLFLAQAERAVEGGATAIAGRAPASRERMWTTLWFAGLWQHFGFFPVPLAVAGTMLLRQPAAWLWRQLSRLSLAVAVIFAVLPFITLVSNSPRYLMFNLLPIAVGSAAATAALWRHSRTARAAVIMIAAVVLSNSIWFWLTPMLYRIRPPEPF